MADKKKTDNSLIKNRKAWHDYEIHDKLEAGIELCGTEVKSCKLRNLSIADAYVRIEGGQAMLHGIHISTYEFGNRFNHEPRRPRRLLMHKSEIRKLSQQVREKGNTIIPLEIYVKNGRVKVEIGVAKGKTHGDKRDSLRAKSDAMEMRRIAKIR